MKGRLIYTILLGIILVACGTPSVPRPYGYFRVDMPEHAYRPMQLGVCPVVAEVSQSAVIEIKEDPSWLDIRYPHLNARVHCSYKPVHGNLRELSDDAQEFVFKHAGVASSIPEQGFDNPDKQVYGVFYELNGNTASPCQFYTTDSVRHFFRGSLYFECIPNQDSLAPMAEYIAEDMRHLMETMVWVNGRP